MTDRLLRLLLTAFHRLSLRRRGRSPARRGAHAVALTPARRVILVKLRYAPGWRLPGGGRGESEALEDAAIRELREEIGMTAHGAVRRAPAIDPALLIVEDVAYRPRWSWEVEAVTEAPLDALPRDLSQRARRWLASVALGIAEPLGPGQEHG